MLFDGLYLVVLCLIDIVVCGVVKYGKWVGVCGVFGGDLFVVLVLVGFGVIELLVDLVLVLGIKVCVCCFDY